jgi:mxaL protein
VTARRLLSWQAAAALLCVAAALHPGFRSTAPGVNAVVAVDITQSMSTTDVALDGKAVARLELVRDALRRTVRALPCGSRIGWAIFTEYRTFLLHLPLEVCAHRRELEATLDRIDNRMAWAGYSEVAKGLHFGIRVVSAIADRPALVLITDGHEAPPLNPRHLPPLELPEGGVRGLIVGVGGDRPVPIPKNDPDGRPLGFWQADEVMQTDIYSQGRAGSEGGEALVESEPGAPARRGPGGQEHLSSLHEEHLRELAARAGIRYARLDAPEALSRALADPTLAIPQPVRVDLSGWFAGAALVALLVPLASGRHARL